MDFEATIEFYLRRLEGYQTRIEKILVDPFQMHRTITTLEQAEAVLRQGIADTLAALDTVKPEQIGSKVDAPGVGQAPFTFFMTIPARHLDGHAAQIDYLQTCWDDQEVHLSRRA